MDIKHEKSRSGHELATLYFHRADSHSPPPPVSVSEATSGNQQQSRSRPPLRTTEMPDFATMDYCNAVSTPQRENRELAGEISRSAETNEANHIFDRLQPTNDDAVLVPNVSRRQPAVVQPHTSLHNGIPLLHLEKGDRVIHRAASRAGAGSSEAQKDVVRIRRRSAQSFWVEFWSDWFSRMFSRR